MKASERRLITILAALAALCGGAILSQRMLRQQHAIEQREHALELRQAEAHAMLSDAELWKQRLKWLHLSQPEMASENQASEELLEALLASAASHSLQVQKKQLHEPVTKAFHREVGVTLAVKGTLPSIFHWMHRVLSPESFCEVPQLKIIPDTADHSTVIATIHFARLYTPATATTNLQEPPQS